LINEKAGRLKVRAGRATTITEASKRGEGKKIEGAPIMKTAKQIRE